jgi:carbamoyltransferase
LSQSYNFNNKLESLYLGPKYDITKEQIIDKVKSKNLEISSVEYSDVVKLLREKNVIAMFQGRSENGPRALGNRSIIFDPTFKDGKDHVNRIKKREFFRPFAATILHEYVNEWFDMKTLEESPFMMYAVNCLEDKKEIIPSVIHIDGTCRIQTLKYSQNKYFYELIKSFYDETGVPLLFNTSFNLGGQPLVETIDDAIDTFYDSKINFLYLPELKIVHKTSISQVKYEKIQRRLQRKKTKNIRKCLL